MSKWQEVTEVIENQWVAGQLVEVDDDGRPVAFCALGAIGHVVIGKEFDERADYVPLRNDRRARGMVHRLAERLRRNVRKDIGKEALDAHCVDTKDGDDQHIVIEINDNFGKGHILKALAQIEAENAKKRKMAPDFSELEKNNEVKVVRKVREEVSEKVAERA